MLTCRTSKYILVQVTSYKIRKCDLDALSKLKYNLRVTAVILLNGVWGQLQNKTVITVLSSTLTV